ncbi:hypothetical protein V6N11_044779 [Hibiscus sabdariffa]|uniref:Uncharacterized protein n=1 Tax=Hibiscus sabdariffa TaxID=183260 RepID=A0ABR2PTV9_9ROSI
MICLGSGGRLSRRTEAGSSLMWTNNVALVFELECKVFLSWILIPLQRPWGVPKLLAEIDSFVHGGEYAFGAHDYPTSGVFVVKP